MSLKDIEFKSNQSVKKYIPKAGTEVARTLAAPRLIGTEIGILGGRAFESDTIADLNVRLGIQEE